MSNHENAFENAVSHTANGSDDVTNNLFNAAMPTTLDEVGKAPGGRCEGSGRMLVEKGTLPSCTMDDTSSGAIHGRGAVAGSLRTGVEHGVTARNGELCGGDGVTAQSGVLKAKEILGQNGETAWSGVVGAGDGFIAAKPVSTEGMVMKQPLANPEQAGTTAAPAGFHNAEAQMSRR